MLLSSGLLSLNVHDALTFDGTEIVIHPDLFDTGAASVNTTRHSVLTKSMASGGASLATTVQRHHERQPSEGSLSTAITDHQKGDGKTPEAPQSASASHASHTCTNTKRLVPGDLLEIKVWDPIPGCRTSGRQRSTMMMLSRTSSADSVPTAVVSTSMNDKRAGLSSRPSSATTKATLEAAALALKNPKPKTSAASMQHALDWHSPSSITRTPDITRTPEPLRSPNLGVDRKGAEDVCDSSSVSTVEHDKTTPLEESPKGSRSRILDPLRPQGKPPLIQRNKTPGLATYVKQAKPAHFRDISDMTMDTLVGVNYMTSDGGGTDLGAHSMDSHDLDPSQDVLSRVLSTHTLRLSIVMLVAEKTLTSLKGQARSQISILRQVADLYNLSPYDMVTVSRVENEPSVLETVSADFVAVTIKDQFISRGDMHFFQKSLIGRWIYEGERLSDTRGIKAYAREIRHADNLARSGIVTEDTKITFRSRSTRIIWLVQISSEMWDYACPYEPDEDRTEESICELVFDKFVRFMYKLFKKWKEMEATHSLTVVFFSRTFITNQNGKYTKQRGQDVYGRHYEDQYKTVVDNETHTDWDSLVVRIKRAFVRFPFEVGWDLSKNGGRRPSTAMQGNLLEAINVTLNLLQFHFLDRDLHRTGNSIVVVSPECGVFEVDKSLAGITYQRMMDNGIGSDMVCLGRPPLHVAPFFLYNNVYNERDNDDNESQRSGPIETEGDKLFSEVPHWMHLSFVSYDGETTEHSQKDLMQTPVLPTVEEKLPVNLSIAPNGFLMAGATSRAGATAETVQAAPFDVVKSSPLSAGITKSQSQQRQLISGRDFKDILKACRPRTSSYMLPSPLTNLLRIQESQNSSEGNSSEAKDAGKPTSNMDNAGRLRLKEWGTVDFDDADGPMSYAGSNAVILRRTRSPAPGGEPSEASDKSSQSSSFASQRSNMLPRSLERGTPTYSFFSGSQAPSPSLSIGGMQIQRSPSLEFDSAEAKLEESDVEALLRMMQEHDEQYSRDPLELVRPKVDTSGLAPSIVGEEKRDGGDDFGTSFGSEASGGLGAALMRYNASGEPIPGSRAPKSPKRYSSGRMQIVGSPSRPGGGMDVSGRSASSLLMFGGSRVGSEPPELTHIPPQVKQAFMRSQHQYRLVQDEVTGSLSGSFDQRRTTSRPFRPLSGARISEARQLSKSPPTRVKIGVKMSPSANSHMNAAKIASSKPQQNGLSRSRSRGSKHGASNKKSVVNPFRQQDEDDELAKKSHNRRRWSHVFPRGELEFKRHAGPLWKSLCQPAILPLTIDYFPSPQELEDVEAYQFAPYQLTLQGMEHTHYESHRELLLEMVRQRITQDFQVVPPSVLSASNAVSEGDIQHTLSMGHRIHVLTYDSQSDTIHVKLYTAITGDDKPFTYHYFVYSPSTKSYRRVVQTFEKYSKPYHWNSVDQLILGDIDKGLSEAMRCRRLHFGLIPPKSLDDAAEQEYIDKFKRLLDYLGKLQEKEDASQELDVKIVRKADERTAPSKGLINLLSGTTEKMRRFTIPLRKKENDLYECAEVSIDSTFDTTRSYRIMLQWLVASTNKVEAQVHSLQRRCVQYGLELTTFPQLSISRDLFVNPFVVPEIFCTRHPGKSPEIKAMLFEQDFIADGIHMTEPSYLFTIDKIKDFKFPFKRRSTDVRSVAARQFVHRTASVFARLIVDEEARVVLAVFLNHRIIKEKEGLRPIVEAMVAKIQCFMDAFDVSAEPVAT